MTVSTSVYKAGPYAGSGTTGPFTVTFRFLANSHLRVIKTSTTGSETTLNLGVDYSVTGAGGASGTVTLTSPLLTGEKLTIVRNVPLTQETDYVVDDSFPAESHEQALDKLTMIAQQLAEEVDRAVKVLPSSTDDPDALIASIKTSEQNAAASAASAAASYDEFDDRYLGSKTSNPTVDNDGNALQVGAEYWNSVSNERRTWTGSAWVSSITVIPDNSVTTAKLAPVIAPVVSSLNGGQLAGFRNRIINGAMAIDQRNNGAAVSITTGSALAYTVDRWFVWVTGTGNIAGVQRVSSGTSPNEFLLQIGNGGSGRTVRVAQRIEASDSQDLAGTVATLSADLARTPTSGTVVTWTASYANTRDSFGTVAAPTKTQIATGNFTISNTVTRYSTQISIPSAAITGIEIEFSWITSSTVSDNVIGRVQLEPGSVATPFEHLPIGAELALCQRYYWRLSGTTQQQIAMAWCETTTRCRPFIKTPVPMRSIPSCNSSTITSFFIRGGGTNIAVSSSTGGWIAPTVDTIVNELNTATAHGGAAGGAAVLVTPSDAWFIDAASEL